jgi:hypothetical protein
MNPHPAAPTAHESVAQAQAPTPSTAATFETPVVDAAVRSSKT